MANKLKLRLLKTPEELMEAVEVMRSAWGMKDYREAPPLHLLKGVVENGGLVIGAFDEERLVGVSFVFIGWRKDVGYYFYSHMTGVAEYSKYKGIGFLLKKEQRRLALEKGYKLMEWTYDPLQSINSHFNLAKLGVIARRYYRDYYGEITDEINRGLGTDRVKAEWHLTSMRVVMKLAGGLKTPPAEEILSMGFEVADLTEPINGYRRVSKIFLDSKAEVVLVEIPRDLYKLKKRYPKLAREWRLASRRIYEAYLSRGYILFEHVFSRDGRSFVVLWRKPLHKILEGETPWS